MITNKNEQNYRLSDEAINSLRTFANLQAQTGENKFVFVPNEAYAEQHRKNGYNPTNGFFTLDTEVYHIMDLRHAGYIEYYEGNPTQGLHDHRITEAGYRRLMQDTVNAAWQEVYKMRYTDFGKQSVLTNTEAMKALNDTDSKRVKEINKAISALNVLLIGFGESLDKNYEDEE